MSRRQSHVPASSPEAQENYMISLAMDLAEKKLIDGTAPSQLITYILKLATERERLERQLLAKQVELAEAKTESIRSEKTTAELYQNALRAVSRYNGDFSHDYDE